MSFSIDTRMLPCLASYAEAAALYEATKVVRGRDKTYSGVPLRRDRRNHGHLFLKREGASVAAYLYRTAVVRWHEDGRVEVDASYDSQSTSKFITALLPHVYVHGVTVRFQSAPGAAPSAVRGAVYGSVTLRATPAGYWLADPDTCESLAVRRVNRKAAKAVRKLAAPLLDYLRTMDALGVTADTMRGVPFVGLYGHSLEDMCDPEAFPSMFRSLCYASKSRLIMQTQSFRRLDDRLLELGGAHYYEPLAFGEYHPKAIVAPN
jgi:hypothetical protein